MYAAGSIIQNLIVYRSADEKNAISHRKRAIEAMRDYFINKSKN